MIKIVFCEPKEPFLEIKGKKIFVDEKIHYNFQFMKKYLFLL